MKHNLNLQTFIKESLIKDDPTAVVTLTNELEIINYSNAFLEEFNIEKYDLKGEKLLDVLTELPQEIIGYLNDALQGKPSSNEGEQFDINRGIHHWYKWKMNPWKKNEEEIGGVILVIEDITNAKREEELLLGALRVARIGGWELDLLKNKIYWTDITREIHETPVDFQPDLASGINFYKEGYSRDTISKLVSDSMKTGAPWDVELQLVTYTNKEIWVRAKGEAQIINGECVRLFGTFQDIDQQKKRDIAYKKVSERLNVAKNAAKIGIWEYHINENSLTWDQTMYELYGIEETDFSGVYEAWKASVHPEDQERCQEEINQAIEGKKDFNTTFRVVWPSGEVRHIRAASVLQKVSTGDSYVMIGVNWDITELIRAKLSLERSEESFQGAFQNSAVGMAIVGLDGKWIDVNDTICNSLGYTKKKLLSLSFQDITHPDDLHTDMSLLKEVVDGSRNSYTMEKKYFHAKGHLVYVILTVTAVKDIDGNLLHFISQIVDISSRIIAEDRLKKILEITNHQNKSLLNFAHIVSHNLRSHSSNLSMLSNFLLEEKDEAEKKTIEKLIRDSSNSLNETVLHLNEVVQVKTTVVENLESIPLKEVLLQVKNSINGLIEKHQVVCTMEIPDKLKVKAVSAYLESILLNLFTNSIKYKHPNRTPKLHIKAYISGNQKVLSFSDNGMGIDLKKHENKIFGMYKTFHNHPEAKGIGLFITKNQVEAMNGRIEVESEVDKGTTFKVYFKID